MEANTPTAFLASPNLAVFGQLTYIALSSLTTIWVARTLRKNGRAFLADAFNGNTALSDSVNQLLVVGFYLINLGWVLLQVRTYYGDTLPMLIEGVAARLGLALLVLGTMHFFNVFVFNRFRKAAMWRHAPAPIAPTGHRYESGPATRPGNS